MKKRLWTSLILSLFLSACGLSTQNNSPTTTPIPTNVDATRTAVAAAIFDTQTAAPPVATALPTRTSWPTPAPTITSTPTIVPTPTRTIKPDEIPDLILCYQAAVSVYADWDAYIKIIGRGGYSESLDRALYQFREERKNRVVRFVFKKDEVFNKFDVIDKVLIKGVDLRDTSACKPYIKDITAVSEVIDTYNPWGVGSTERRNVWNFKMKSMVKTMRKGLIEVYGVDEAELDAIDLPIWTNVANGYGVEIPEY